MQKNSKYCIDLVPQKSKTKLENLISYKQNKNVQAL